MSCWSVSRLEGKHVWLHKDACSAQQQLMPVVVADAQLFVAVAFAVL
jgi:hypothetical protein